MRVALFITCVNDTLFPDTGKAVVRLLERLGCTVEFPAEQTCCGQMHFNTGYRDEARAAGPALRRRLRRLRRRRRAVGVVRGDGPRVVPRPARGVDGRPPGSTSCRSSCRRAGRDRRRRLLPAPGDLPPDLPLAALAPGRRRARWAAAAGTRPDAGAARRRGGVLRLRRHVRAEEPRVSAAMCADKVRSVLRHRRRGALRRRQLLPDAHRRRPVPAAYGRAGHAPRRDPRRHREQGRR